MKRATFIVVSTDTDDIEAFGPFATQETAEKFRDEYEEEVRPFVSYLVCELIGSRDGRNTIRDAKENW